MAPDHEKFRSPDDEFDPNASYRGRWWVKNGDRILCQLCPRACNIPEGKRGFCFVRQNIGGEMVLTTYGKSTGFCIDPIEKKPLNHFLPGTPILSFGTAGCNLGCKFCQNWDISKAREVEILSDYASPEKVVRAAQTAECRSIAYTYNDPVIWAEYAIDTAKVARERGIKNVAVTAGYITREARDEFYRYMDAANVDLKAFTESFYKNVTLSELKPVLETLRWLKHETNVWFEITNLMIPDENDSPDEIKRMVEWILENLGDRVPIHFTAFHPDYKMLEKVATPVETLMRARRQALDAGIKYAYVGNCHDLPGQSTYCPECNSLAIERDWYTLGAYKLTNSKCNKCKATIDGVFEEHPGSWGAKRQPVSVNEDDEDAARVTLRREKAAKARSAQTPNRSASKTKEQVSASAEKPSAGPSSEITFAPKTTFTNEESLAMLRYCREIVQHVVVGNATTTPLPEDLASAPAYGAFITLKRGGLLRSCRGRWGSSEPTPLGRVLEESTTDTAQFDPRFPSLHARELPLLSLEISLLHDPHTLIETGRDRINAVRVGEHGLVVIHPRGRGLLLPQVAIEAQWDAETFLRRTSEKAGLAQNTWAEAETSIITFRAERFFSPPQYSEVDSYAISDDVLHQLFRAAQMVCSGNVGEIKVPKFVLDEHVPEIGIALRTTSGGEVLRFAGRASLMKLLEVAAQELRAKNNQGAQSVLELAGLSVLTTPIPLRAEDYPERVRMMGPGALLVKGNGKLSFFVARQGDTRDPFLLALANIGASLSDWQNGSVELTSFRSRTLARAEAPKDAMTRPPAISGTFYPAAPAEMERELQSLIPNSKRASRGEIPVVMVPHAGWRFCGDIIGKTLSQVPIPDRVIILGPKHTPFGPRWSVASHLWWQIPGATIGVARDIVDDLVARIPGLVREASAHQAEHGSEVIIPFLRYLNPTVRVCPIALGATTFEEASVFAGALSKSLKHFADNPPLVIVSSDMNHFDSEEENRRKDGMALEVLRERDPLKLFEICRTEGISMCGVVPAVIALKMLEHDCPKYSVEITDYQTSARVTGDSSRVVGYAGALFRR